MNPKAKASATDSLDQFVAAIVALEREVDGLAHGARTLSEQHLLENPEFFRIPLDAWGAKVHARRVSLVRVSDLTGQKDLFDERWSLQDSEHVRFCLGSWEPEMNFSTQLIAVPYVFYHRVLLVALARCDQLEPKNYFAVRENCRQLVSEMDALVQADGSFQNLNRTLFKAG